MPTRLARLVTITWGDGDYEQYENVTVEEHRSSRLFEEPETRFKTITVTDKLLKAKGTPPAPPEKSSPTSAVKSG
jgi:hypothetical protein